MLAAGLNPLGLAWPNFTLAVDPADEVVGCVQLKPHRGEITELASLLVVEDWHGRGVARTLIEHALASHQGPLYLMCRTGLGDFYRKFGFISLDENEMPPYYRRMVRLVKIFNILRPSGEGLLIMRHNTELLS